EGVVDTCGTGGGAVTTFNISTAAAIVAAATGVRIAKHGNRSFSSRCGSADVLEALGVRIELSPEQMGAVLEETGIVFMFAPLLHPAMRHVGPVRRELAMPTIMNVLVPLANPAGAQRQVVGVADPRLMELIARALSELGHDHALVVHGEPGLDEISPLGITTGVEVQHGELRPVRIDPADYGWTGLMAADLAGGDPPDHARMIREIRPGRTPGAARDALEPRSTCRAGLRRCRRVSSVRRPPSRKVRRLVLWNDCGWRRTRCERQGIGDMPIRRIRSVARDDRLQRPRPENRTGRKREYHVRRVLPAAAAYHEPAPRLGHLSASRFADRDHAARPAPVPLRRHQYRRITPTTMPCTITLCDGKYMGFIRSFAGCSRMRPSRSR